MSKVKAKREQNKIDRRLKEAVTIKDADLLHKLIGSLKAEFHLKDFFQVVIGASILAIPVGFTEETWHLGEILPLFNVFGFMIISLFFISAFVYYNYYRHRIKDHWGVFIKRTLITYVVSFVIVALLLTLIQRTPWSTDFLIAFKRVVIVTFPASMSAAIADVIK